MMSLLPFWALNLSVVLLSMQEQKALRFHPNILICVPKMNEGLMGLERHYSFKHATVKPGMCFMSINRLNFDSLQLCKPTESGSNVTDCIIWDR